MKHVNMIMCGDSHFVEVCDTWFISVLWFRCEETAGFPGVLRRILVCLLSPNSSDTPPVPSHSAFRELIPRDQFLAHRLYNGGVRK